jgi:hypothetical protein
VEGRLQRHQPAERVTQEIAPTPDGIEHCGDVYELALKRIVGAVSAIASPTSIECVDGEMLR